jgi:histidinol-phosphate aminotransferase
MIDKILKLARPDIVGLKAYCSAKREGVVGDIYLNANENPYKKPSIERLNRYPDPQPKLLRSLLSGLYGVNDNEVLLTRGADEGIDLIIRAFCRAGIDSIMICPPTYDMYSVSARVQNSQVLEVPLLANEFSLNIEAIYTGWQKTCKIIFICSPNNPTGNCLDADEILKLCKALEEKCLIVIDEAYIEFSDQASLAKYLNEYSNLVVLRTLSKAYGLAGVRCGAVLAHRNIISLLETIIAPYPISCLVEDIVVEELSGQNMSNIQSQINEIISQRESMLGFLKKLPFVRYVWPSQANFILIKIDDAKNVINHCAKHKVIIRNRSNMHGLDNCIRISVGLPDENVYLKETLLGLCK